MESLRHHQQLPVLPGTNTASPLQSTMHMCVLDIVLCEALTR